MYILSWISENLQVVLSEMSTKVRRIHTIFVLIFQSGLDWSGEQTDQSTNQHCCHHGQTQMWQKNNCIAKSGDLQPIWIWELASWLRVVYVESGVTSLWPGSQKRQLSFMMISLDLCTCLPLIGPCPPCTVTRSGAPTWTEQCQGYQVLGSSWSRFWPGWVTGQKRSTSLSLISGLF